MSVIATHIFKCCWPALAKQQTITKPLKVLVTQCQPLYYKCWNYYNHYGSTLNHVILKMSAVWNCFFCFSLEHSQLHSFYFHNYRCPKSLYYSEYRLIMFRHIIMIKRINFNYYIIIWEDHDLIKRVYLKQKESLLKGDWIHSVRKDYQFIGEELENMEDFIKNTSKEVFSKIIKHRVYKAAFKSYLEMKEWCKKKMSQLTYEEFKIRDYLTSTQLNSEEKRILFSLRSNCYPAKINFKNMNKGNLKCSLNCDEIETQIHIFENCEPVLSRLNLTQTLPLNSIYGSLSEQKSAVELFFFENWQNQKTDDQQPSTWGRHWQDPRFY